MQSNKRKPEICTTYGHVLVANHDCPSCNHRVCRWCYVDEKEIRIQARERGEKPNFSGPPDLGAVRFHERRVAAQATAQKAAAIESPLPEITVPRRRKAGVTAKASNAPGRARSSGLT
jgi:hypothetical protein